MIAYELYTRMKTKYDTSDERALAEEHGYADDVQLFYKELYDIDYQRELREDFSDEEFKTFFYSEYTGEISDETVKIGDYMLVIAFIPHIKQTLQLDITCISTDRQIASIDKDRIWTSFKYFKTLDTLNAFVIELKMIFSDRYKIWINRQ